MTTLGVQTIDSILDEARVTRAATRRARARAALAIPVAVAVVWVAHVTAAGQWGRAADHWQAGVTMAFGSFVAGSTPQGGGAVAFPVFTKVLKIDPEVARSFSLSIQTIGMGAATLAIIATRRRVEWMVVAVVTPAAITGFLAGLFLVGRPGVAFWPAALPSDYVKVTFSVIVAAMAFVVYITYRPQLLLRADRLPSWNRRIVALLIGTGLLGGILSSLVGSGADVCLFIAVAILLGVSPRIALTSSVVVMSAVSAVGLLVLGVVDGQLQGPPGAEVDLFGLWLAAVPIVAIGAPLGSWIASRISERKLVVFVLALGVIEVATTVLFLDALRSDPRLLTFAVLTAGGTLWVLWFLSRRQRELFSLPPLDLEAPIARGQIDAGPHYRDDLIKGGSR